MSDTAEAAVVYELQHRVEPSLRNAFAHTEHYIAWTMEVYILRTGYWLAVHETAAIDSEARAITMPNVPFKVPHTLVAMAMGCGGRIVFKLHRYAYNIQPTNL